MNTHCETVNPYLCPICKQDNRCGNVSDTDSSENCWCSSAEVTFSGTLLNKIPLEAKNKACICKNCALENREP